MKIGMLGVMGAAVMAAGCFQGQRTFKVNADGSGTIVDSVKLGEQAKGMLAGMEGMDQTPAAEKAAKKKAKYAESAAAMGAGVTYVSTVPGKDGAEVTTYAFKDINTLRAAPMPNPDASTTSKSEPITFKLSKSSAGNSLLTITAAPRKAAEPPAGEKKKSKEETAQAIQMMKGMLAGLSLKSVVEVNGRLVKSSSPHAAGSAVTLMSIDFDQLDAAALEKLADAGPGKPPGPEMLRGIKGITVSDDQVTIEFAGK
jgi:hypothetical protein